jgi:hypothetical protein
MQLESSELRKRLDNFDRESILRNYTGYCRREIQSTDDPDVQKQRSRIHIPTMEIC